MKPFISVVIIAYNRKQFIKEAINSVLNQTLNKELYEIIVVKNFEDRKIDNYINKNKIKNIYLNTSIAKSIGYKMAEGIKKARGDVICFLEDDDTFCRGKLAYVYKTFNSLKSVGYLHNNIYIVNENGNVLRGNLNKYYKNKDIIIDENQKDPINLLRLEYNNSFFNLSSIQIRKNCLEDYIIKLKRYRDYGIGMDLFIYALALNSNYKLYLSNKKLTRYMVHNSTSISLTGTYDSFVKRVVQINKIQLKVESQLEQYSKTKNIKTYFHLRKNNMATLYLFYKGNYRKEILCNYLKNFYFSFIANPKVTVYGGLEVAFYTVSPEKFRFFKYKRTQKYFNTLNNS